MVEAFRRYGVDFEPRVLPCGHYTTGETPYKYIDGWHMGWFVYRAFKALREEKARGRVRSPSREEELLQRGGSSQSKGHLAQFVTEPRRRTCICSSSLRAASRPAANQTASIGSATPCYRAHSDPA